MHVNSSRVLESVDEVVAVTRNIRSKLLCEAFHHPRRTSKSFEPANQLGGACARKRSSHNLHILPLCLLPAPFPGTFELPPSKDRLLKPALVALFGPKV